jgi:hypothetical protein
LWNQQKHIKKKFQFWDYVLWFPKGENTHLGKFKVQYCLPNNIYFLVYVNNFEPNPILVNVNKLKPYRCHYEKKGVLQLALKLNFLVTMNTCNSLYLYAISFNGLLHEIQSCNSLYIWCNSLQLN